MDWLDNINSENFNISFNRNNILKNSIFYPASGIDDRAIECLSVYSKSFVNVDYSILQNDVEDVLRTHFEPVGYRLIGLRFIEERDMTPNGFTPHFFPEQDSEKERSHFLIDSIRNFTPFALWAVFELDEKLSNQKSGKMDKFSILHIGGEACATFDALYVNNGVNPLGIAILNPGEGYGDNWTNFRDPEFRFYNLIRHNVESNGQPFPKYLCTNMCLGDDCFWPNYDLLNRGGPNNCNTYEYNN